MRRIALLTLITLVSFSMNDLSAKSRDRYFRQIAYNHVSPHIPVRGIHEMTKEETEGESYYIFTYDATGRLIQIINKHFATERRHPLTTIGAYQTKISYTNGKETWTYYDPKGTQVDNDRRVFVEEFLVDKKGFRYQLNFYNKDMEPMESMWKVSKYQWEKKKNLVIEKRYNAAGEQVDVAPYFKFGITGIAYDKRGYPKAHYNLDENYQVVNNADGLAAYKDQYDENGNHIKWSYYDQDDKMINNQWGYAYGVKEYDEKGNYLTRKTYDENDAFIADQPMATNVRVKLADKPTKADSAEIERISLGYLEALQQMDSSLMKRVMHDQLAKRTVGLDFRSGKENLRETTYDQMIGFSQSWNKTGNKFPYNPSNKAIILDIYDRIATVKLFSDNWVEYLHLARVNGDWKIVNLLWQQKNVNSYANHPK